MAYRTLRSWLRRLAETDRLAVAEPGVDLDFELSAIAKRQDGEKAVLFPAPKRGQANTSNVPVVSGLVSDRAWIAESLGIEPSERRKGSVAWWRVLAFGRADQDAGEDFEWIMRPELVETLQAMKWA